MRNLSFSKLNSGFKKILSVICALSIVLSVVMVVPIVAKADNAEKMFVIKPTTKNADGTFKYANVFIPINFREVGDVTLSGYTYFKFSFKARNMSKGKPIVGVVRNNYDTDGSFSEQYWAYNNDANDGKDSSDPNSDKITCTYDPSTYTYTYIIRTNVSSHYKSSVDGSYAAITIGNAEHNAHWYKANSPETHFAFAYPELYAYNIETGKTFGDNLISGINDETVDISKTYKHNPPQTNYPEGKLGWYMAEDSLMMAPANKWGIDTTASLIEYKDIPDGYFDASRHNYVKHDAVKPTVTEPGNKEYYTCECDDCKGKYFFYEGAMEVTWDDIYIGPDGPEKAIIIKPNVDGDQYPSNIFIPLDFKDVSAINNNSYYFQLKFKTKLYDGDMPIVGVVRYNPADGGSFSEQTFSYNNQGTNSDTKVKASYDAATMTYTATIKIDCHTAYKNPKTGAFAAITIGKAEHNGNWYSENDFDSSFIIYKPELYRTNAITGKPTGNNLIVGINNNTVDLSKSYTHRKNAYTSADNLLTAPANVWSVDGPTRYISVSDIPEDFFTAHDYVKHDAVEPTETVGGNNEYFTCECDACKDKYFTDFGLTEITEEQVKIAPNGSEKMIVIGANNSSGTTFANVFVPIDHRVAGDSIFETTLRYYRLTFKAKLYGDKLPIVSVVRYDDGSKGVYSEPYYTYNNNASEWSDSYPALSASYDESTGIFTAVIAVKTWYNITTYKSGAHHAIMIGNAEHNGNWYKEQAFESSFAFYEPELYVYDPATGTVSGENILPGINDNTLNFNTTYKHDKNPCTLSNNILSAPLGKWSIDTGSRLVKSYDIDENYFNPSVDNETMLKVTGGNSDTLLSKDATLKTTVQYKIDFDYKLENGATLDAGLYALNSTGGITDIESAGGKVIVADDNYDGAHFSRIITMPTSGINTSGNNFKLIIGVKSQNEASVAYISGVSVRELSANGDVGNNILPNGSFDFAPAGTVVLDKHLALWNVEDSSKYVSLETMDIPADMFMDTTPNAIFINGAVGNITTFTSVNAGKDYLFRYKSKNISEEIAKPYIEFITNSGSSVKDVYIYRDKDGYYNTICEFTVPSDLVSGKNLRIGVKSDSADVNSVVSGFELYEIDKDGKTIGNNLIKEGTLLNTTALEEYSSNIDMGIWMKQITGGSATIETVGVTYFNEIVPNMLLFKGTSSGSGGNGKIQQDVALQANKKYQLSFNFKAVGTGLEGEKLGAELQYKKGSSFVALTSTKSESDTEYRETYEFTMPSDVGGGSNFRLMFHASSAYTSGYVANFTLNEVDASGNIIGENLISNGDFATGNAAYWAKSGAYYHFEFSEIPENFFSKLTSHKKKMFIYSNATDYAQLSYSPQLKPATKYELTYQSVHTKFEKGKESTVPVWLFYTNEEGKNVDNSTKLEKVTDGATTYSYFTTPETLRTKSNNNAIIRLYMRSGNAGYWSEIELYELDEDGNRVSNNLIINNDFSSGTKCWDKLGDFNMRFVEEPEGFFDNWHEPTDMITSHGTHENEIYGQNLKVDAEKTYVFTGKYVNMNSEGINPQVQYLPRSAKGTNNYKDLPVELYYDTDRYYFEVEFEIPDDALVTEGLADIRVLINNKNKGKGYFTDIMLFESDKYINLLTNPTYSNSGNYEKVKYDPDVFVFYYDDEKFNDGDWSGEWENSKYNIKYGTVTGRIVDEDGNGVAGVKMQLNPGKITVETDKDGNYSFDKVEPGEYKLYLLDKKDSIYCTDVTVQKGIWSMMPLITFIESKTFTSEVQVDGEDSTTEDGETEDYGMLRGFYYDRKGNIIKGATIHLRGVGSSVTDDKGMFMFDKVPVGTHELYTVLEDGSEYVFREVIIEANKGIQVKVMEPASEQQESGIPWVMILIVSGAVFVCAGITLAVILLIKKKK